MRTTAQSQGRCPHTHGPTGDGGRGEEGGRQEEIKHPKDRQRDHGNNQKQTCNERTWWVTEKSSQSASDRPATKGTEQ